MSVSKEDAAAWVRSVAPRHVASNCRQYKWGTYVGQRSTSSALGFQTDLNPVEGKIVEVNDDYVLLKTSRNEFFVAAKHFLASAPDVGAVCRITPYARRRWDGLRLDTPTESIENGIPFKTYRLGDNRSYLPIDKQTIVCDQFRDMIDVIEREPADEIRTVAQMLIDAGALAEPVFFQDVIDPEDIIDKPPTLRFKVSTSKHVGYVEVRYDRAGDCFTVLVLNADMSIKSRNDQVYIAIDSPSEIGRIIIDAVDDGSWKIAPVEILKKAPARKAIAA